MARGDATAAARAFGRAVKLNPVDPEAFYQLGMALAQSGDLAGASTHLWAAHALRADFFEAINEFGLVELQLGRFDTAMDAFLRAAELAPSKANYLYNLATAAEAKGDYTFALRAFNLALTQAPDSGMLLGRGNVKLQLGDFAGAEADYSQALEFEPDQIKPLLNRGAARHRLGKTTAALADFERVLALAPTQANALNGCGSCHAELGNHVRALAFFEQALTHDPDLAAAHFNRGMSRAALHDHLGAMADYSRALEIDRNNPAACLMRGNSQMALGRYAEALADYDQAIALRPGYGDAHHNRAVARQKLGYPGVNPDPEGGDELYPRRR